MLKLYFSLLLSVAASADDGGMSYAHAKAMADRDEGSLSESQQVALNKSQAPIVQAGLSSCLVVNGATPFSFVVVAKLDATGHVIQTWQSTASSLSTCFQEVVAKASLNPPPRNPFYTSFEMNLPESAITH